MNKSANFEKIYKQLFSKNKRLQVMSIIDIR